MNVLGIETSCDETAAAVVSDGRRVRSNVVHSQIAAHRPYGGVVPEIACRQHVELLPRIIRAALDEAGLGWDAIDGVAATRGPGLISSLLIGYTAARALAFQRGLPLQAVNHLEAHLWSAFLGAAAPEPDEVLPCLMLLVSGGHTALIRMLDIGRYTLLGQTLDDAAGEALDKGAKLLQLGYPGGPAIEAAARGGNPAFVRFPRGLEHTPDSEGRDGLPPRLCFSFSGLKTALLYYLRAHPGALEDGPRRDLAASYQAAVVDALIQRVERALDDHPDRALGCVGGVSRNTLLRERLRDLAGRRGVRLLLAEPAYGTDNAAMVAGLAGRRPWPATGADLEDVAANLPVA